MCIGSKVYIGFPKTFENIPQFLKLFVSTTEANASEVSIDTLRGFHVSHTVRNTQTIEVELPIDFEVQNAEQRYKGIKVTSANDQPIIVYGQSYRIGSSGMFAALPCYPQKDVTEYEYYGVSFDGYAYSNTHYMLIVGCESNTVVKIGPLTINLNEMETYMYSDARGVTGTKVVSNKPISFISGHQCKSIPHGGVRDCDHLIEQLPNTAQWGKQFLTAPLFERTAPDIYVIVSHIPSTLTTMVCSDSSETTVITLSEFAKNHEVVTVPENAYCSIDSNNTVLVAQFAQGGDADNTSSDPFMMNIPPIDHYSNNFTVVAPEGFSSVITIFVTPEYHEPERIFVDGMHQGDANWTAIPCQNETLFCGYVARNVDVSEGQHTVYHEMDSAKMSVSMYGFKQYNGYGYYAIGGVKLDYSKSQSPTPTTGSQGVIVGGTIAAILCVVTAALAVLLLSKLYIKRRQRKRINDIARPENIPIGRRDATTTKNNVYDIKDPECAKNVQQLGRCRLSSFYMRELTSGKFCIPSEQILQLDIIGQGIIIISLLVHLSTLSFQGSLGLSTELGWVLEGGLVVWLQLRH
jgi:hypothetical protein